MSLSLKNPPALQLANELSHLTGESLTTAVIRALEDRLEAERGKRSSIRKSERIFAFAERFSCGLTAGSHSADHAGLHSEDGLP
ncbi:MAG: type II toxin-antitoxin system VapB family antitoxin [Bryobacterales bacterium]|nr:type II toxin-antitoxin system VapB family antitoxin [Bryobacterales bacterium]